MGYNVTISGTEYEGIDKVELPITGENTKATFYANTIDDLATGAITSYESDKVFNSLNKIRAYGFYSCMLLQRVSLPNATVLQANTFDACKSLKDVNIPKLDSLIGGSAFFNCSSLEEVDFPNLMHVSPKTFHGCTALKKVNMLGGGNIDANAFSSTALESLIMRSTTMSTLKNTNAMLDNPIEAGTGYIYVPSSLIDSYKSATNWSTYASQFRAIEDYPEICG